jgi:hypothetical protein
VFTLVTGATAGHSSVLGLGCWNKSNTTSTSCAFAVGVSTKHRCERVTVYRRG